MTVGQPGLERRLGLGDATLIGLGSMIGAGVFVAFGPAARAAGSGLLLGLVLAAGVAFCNAVASAQLAAAHPTSGGTYAYGRACLGEVWGFAAGWAFVVGKTASCAAMALAFAAYAIPDPTPDSTAGAGWAQRGVAVIAVLALAALNYRGITRTAVVTRVLVVCVLGVLVAFVVVVSPEVDLSRVGGADGATSQGWYGVLQSAGLLFFAFAGYARIATLGEEVRDPARIIPRAIPLALGATVLVYAVVAVTLLGVLGPERLAASATPLASASALAGAPALGTLLRIGAVLASLGALLALIAGIARTGLAMARHGDLPRWLAAVHPRHRVPHHAEVALAVLVSALVLTTDLRGVIAFSSCCVLVYYAIANACAFTQPPAQRRWPRWLHVVGLLGCATLAVTLPWSAALGAALLLVAGVAGRALLRRTGHPPRSAGAARRRGQ